MDFIYGVVLALALAFCLFLTLNNQRLERKVLDLEQARQNDRRHTETLIRWHIHVAAMLDMEPVKIEETDDE